jgi:hydroxymethylbilane synthase
MTSPLRLGTRGSPLALWQASHVAGLLQAAVPQRLIEFVEITTAGDQVRDAPLPVIGGEGVFTKEIQRALLEDRIDVAVHSLKDLPTVIVDGLLLAAVPPRGPVGDVLISYAHSSFASLPHGAVLATGSLRRRAQLLYRRPDLRLESIRGNVGTRLAKLREQRLDGLVLAEAGLRRLGLAKVITELLDPEWMLPAVGQGALGLECRADDRVTLSLVRRIDDQASHAAVCAERALLRGLGGGCQVPIGAQSKLTGEQLTLRGVVLVPDGTRRIEGQLTARLKDAEDLGRKLADELRSQGAKYLLTGEPGA